MFSKLALSAGIVISAAFPALAATKHHHRVTHVHPAIYNMVPDTGCPANGGPSCSNAIVGDELHSYAAPHPPLTPTKRNCVLGVTSGIDP